jgi:N-acetylglucosaminyldiphosphoundecaprenol N-acetyl-beta-D-mannosaminyltransferase
MSSPTFESILGVRFLNGDADEAIALLSRGALMVVPSAPVLTMLASDPLCRTAVGHADFAIVDSAYMALLWRLMRRRKLRRLSGLEFIRRFLDTGVAREPQALFLVNPSDEERDSNLELLRAHGFEVSPQDCYTAPLYDRREIEDPLLLERIEERAPRYVLINLGGGVQEPLGLYLKQRLSYAPGIICTGAAIAFLTGRQARISPQLDRLGLGWLVRIASDPRRYLPRYWSSLRLAVLLLRNGSSMPPSPG